MRELECVQQALADAAGRGSSVLLVTVLSVEGSVYRGAGARMVVTSDGETIGGVSGGCLEADIAARAPDVIAEGHPRVIRYDTRASDDAVLGLGLGCQGMIDLLLEPLSGDGLAQAAAFYGRLAAQRGPVTLLTLVADEHTQLRIGARAVLDQSGQLIEGDSLLPDMRSNIARELIRPAADLVVCGGGADAVPLVRLAKLMGWKVTVVDHRAAFASQSRFPAADRVVCINATHDATPLQASVTLDGQTIGVVMAHSAAHDRAYLHALLDATVSYIGVLGPKRRTLELLGDRATGGDIPASVHSPVGLDIGAESPDEIALAVVAEIAAAIAGRAGGMLKERSGSIHDRGHVNVSAVETVRRELSV
ncbi:MAG TPA: XdhC family protein [Gemmatimonadaceae bacterium]